jgi:hypothetical protein
MSIIPHFGKGFIIADLRSLGGWFDETENKVRQGATCTNRALLLPDQGSQGLQKGRPATRRAR